MGVICLGILLEIVLPQGKSAKYIKGAFSLLVVLAIASPLPRLLKKDYEISIDTDYFSSAEEGEYTSVYDTFYAQKAKDALSQNGCDANVFVNVSNGVVSEVRVEVCDMVLSGEEIVNITAQILHVDENKISVIYNFYARACARTYTKFCALERAHARAK